jgi:hypothetical protein
MCFGLATIYDGIFGGQSCSLLFQSSLYKTTFRTGSRLVAVHVATKTKAQRQTMVLLHLDNHILETTLLSFGQKPRKHPKSPHWT